ncbi:uncharacterized protein LOC119528115 [Choloepus didactylus]|uniref:uncharacterized protein LOC119528115 n=1 Tax=Choloepus didactylus TaxID=27675 RepID=UPI00189D33E8|nr:uncharacterized protein LOC119528115 [Choloepus didactylus]XP_037684735.1 uncharacterized protein LOC119528115 [Choloepus didactylus]
MLVVGKALAICHLLPALRGRPCPHFGLRPHRGGERSTSVPARGSQGTRRLSLPGSMPTFDLFPALLPGPAKATGMERGHGSEVHAKLLGPEVTELSAVGLPAKGWGTPGLCLCPLSRGQGLPQVPEGAMLCPFPEVGELPPRPPGWGGSCGRLWELQGLSLKRVSLSVIRLASPSCSDLSGPFREAQNMPEAPCICHLSPPRFTPQQAPTSTAGPLDRQVPRSWTPRGPGNWPAAPS